MRKNYKIYLHRKMTSGEVYYVGMTCRKHRPYDTISRNPSWKEVFHNDGLVVEIYKDKLTQKSAENLERKLIREYGRLVDGSGTLVNIAHGVSRYVYLYDAFDNLVSEYSSIEEASIQLGEKTGTISGRAKRNYYVRESGMRYSFLNRRDLLSYLYK